MTTLENIWAKCTEKNAILCLATKGRTAEEIAEKLIFPNIIVAENRVQEAETKLDFFQKIPHEKHFIGELQHNKIRKAIKIFDCIQSVHSFKILEKINQIAFEEGKKQKIFLSLNISSDEHKSGFSEMTFLDAIDKKIFVSMQNIEICGLFCMLKNNLSDTEKAFFYEKMRKIFDTVLPHFGENFVHLSMGMSDDFEIALQNGSTMVRIGSAIFGERN